jgi:hypothetical protein
VTAAKTKESLINTDDFVATYYVGGKICALLKNEHLETGQRYSDKPR